MEIKNAIMIYGQGALEDCDLDLADKSVRNSDVSHRIIICVTMVVLVIAGMDDIRR